jgi:hypothetical protein
MSDRRIDVTTPYSWVRHGYLPYEPLPSAVATVLSRQLGIEVTVNDIWPQRRREAHHSDGAVDDFAEMATLDDAVSSLRSLASAALPPVPTVRPANGADLAAAVMDGLTRPLRRRDRVRNAEHLTPVQVEVLAEHVATLRRLDDRHGGGVLSLRYVSGQLRLVVDLLESTDYDAPTGRRLLQVVADLAQLQGWLQFDAQRYGPAERYLLLSARIAHAIGENGRAVNAIGMIAYVAAFAGHGRQATRIAELAQRMCPADDLLLQSRIWGRLATAAAADGDIIGFRRATERSQDLLHQADASKLPSYLYYLEPEQLTAETGQGLVTLAQYIPTYKTMLLGEAIELLSPISHAEARQDYPRSALIHGCFLARAHLAAGGIEAAHAAARDAWTRLEDVRSLRGRAQLLHVREDLARHRRASGGAAFLDELDAALSDYDQVVHPPHP